MAIFAGENFHTMDPERLKKIRAQLNEMHSWPSMYMFKFVLPSDSDRINKLKRIFDESAEFKMKKSRKGNYTSITVKEMIMEVDVIFERYNEASKIEGIISL
jgi:putative lipoic acid-binding regulatory protein